nr:hypothetical protein [Mycoplasmopsis bovis]
MLKLVIKYVVEPAEYLNDLFFLKAFELLLFFTVVIIALMI